MRRGTSCEIAHFDHAMGNCARTAQGRVAQELQRLQSSVRDPADNRSANVNADADLSVVGSSLANTVLRVSMPFQISKTEWSELRYNFPFDAEHAHNAVPRC